MNERATSHSGRPLALEREASLRQRLIARDERALIEVIDLASPWLLGVADAVLDDRAEAEEVVADTFRIAWDKVGTLPPGEDQRLFPWLFRIVRNRAIDRVRARRRRRLKLQRLANVSHPDDRRASPAEPDEAALPGWHVHESVKAALAGLPPEQEAAVRLAYYRGLTHSEIAARLDIPLGTVKTRLRLAFDKLRAALQPLREWVE